MTRPPALHRHVLHPSLAGKLCPTLYVFPLYLHAEKIQGECWAFVWTLTVLLLFKGILYKRKQCSCWILKHCFDYRNKKFETNDMYLKLVFLLCSVFVFAFIEYNLYFYALTINAYRGLVNWFFWWTTDFWCIFFLYMWLYPRFCTDTCYIRQPTGTSVPVCRPCPCTYMLEHRALNCHTELYIIRVLSLRFKGIVQYYQYMYLHLLSFISDYYISSLSHICSVLRHI